MPRCERADCFRAFLMLTFRHRGPPAGFTELATRSGCRFRATPGARRHLGGSLEALPERRQQGLSRGVGPAPGFPAAPRATAACGEATATMWSLSGQQRGEDLRQSGGEQGTMTPVPARREGPPQESRDVDPRDGVGGVGEGTTGVAQGHARTGGSVGRVDPDEVMGPRCRQEAWAGGSGKAFNRDREGKVENQGRGRPGCSWGPWTGSKAATPRKDRWDPQPRDGVGAELRVRGRGHQVLRLPRAEGARLGRGRAAIPRPCASLQTQDATALSSRATRPARPELRGALPASRAWSPWVGPEKAASRGLPGPGVAA